MAIDVVWDSKHWERLFASLITNISARSSIKQDHQSIRDSVLLLISSINKTLVNVSRDDP